jgi:hypothetical protein
MYQIAAPAKNSQRKMYEVRANSAVTGSALIICPGQKIAFEDMLTRSFWQKYATEYHEERERQYVWHLDKPRKSEPSQLTWIGPDSLLE